MAHHADHAHGDEAHPEVGHVVPVRYLYAAGLALLVLTVVTVAVRYLDLGEANMPVALGIALVKATIVALIFMHLRWDRPFNLLVLIGSIVFVLLLIAFTSMDVHQYEPSIFGGNAPEAQATLDANAPGAPVAQMKSPDM
ncbi:MAG: cytochrome C oxidase subunit IV family protein [Phycisphaerales bacterium]